MTVFVKRWFMTIFNANVNVSCSVKVGMKLLNTEKQVTRNFIPQILLNVQEGLLLPQVMTKASSDLRQSIVKQ
jgi:hypothetical protein